MSGCGSRREAERQRLMAHQGRATWGERLVPLGEFRQVAERSGHALSATERRSRRQAWTAELHDDTPVEGPFRRVALFGGVYANHLSLQALIQDAARRGAEALYCLGDLGGFGPHPEKVWPLLREAGVHTLAGNYEESLAAGGEDCNCGYTDPRDNHFAELSYRYTAQNCSDQFKAWMGELPARRRLRLGDQELLLVHGSPRRVNEFLFDSSTPNPYLEVLLDQAGADALACTHTGLHWQRHLPSGRLALNVGVIGRPANDGQSHVWYAMAEAGAQGPQVEFVPLAYDHERLAAEMRSEDLPQEFVDTIQTGWWTTCLEILPARERAAGKF